METYDFGVVTVIWNGSATFNTFIGGKPVDSFTHYNVADRGHAFEIAEQHVKDMF